jgi:hypothetical protein
LVLCAVGGAKLPGNHFNISPGPMVDLLWSSHLTPLDFLWYIELQNFEETEIVRIGFD